jgi:hypothetical protein
MTLVFTAPGGVTYIEYRDLTDAVTTISSATVPIGAKPILLETGPLR